MRQSAKPKASHERGKPAIGDLRRVGIVGAIHDAMKLYTFTTSAFRDESLVEMKGFSHRSQPFQKAASWYPFQEWKVKVFLYAKNRTHAVRQLLQAGCNDVRDLDCGSKCVVPQCITKLFSD